MGSIASSTSEVRVGTTLQQKSHTVFVLAHYCLETRHKGGITSNIYVSLRHNSRIFPTLESTSVFKDQATYAHSPLTTTHLFVRSPT